MKSDKHEVLAREALGVEGMAKQLLNGEGCTYELSASWVNSERGRGLATELPGLARRVSVFFEQYAQHRDK